MKTTIKMIAAVICVMIIAFSANFASAKNTGKLSLKTTAEYVKDNRHDCYGNALPALVKGDSTEMTINLTVDCGKDADKDANAKADASAKTQTAGFGGSDLGMVGLILGIIALVILGLSIFNNHQRRNAPAAPFSNDIHQLAQTLCLQGSMCGSGVITDRDEHGRSRSASFQFNPPTTEVVQLRNQTPPRQP